MKYTKETIKTTITGEQLKITAEQLIDYLTKFNPDLCCSMCKQRQFGFRYTPDGYIRMLSISSLDTAPTPNEQGSHILTSHHSPKYELLCSNCGHSMLFDSTITAEKIFYSAEGDE